MVEALDDESFRMPRPTYTESTRSDEYVRTTGGMKGAMSDQAAARGGVCESHCQQSAYTFKSLSWILLGL